MQSLEQSLRNSDISGNARVHVGNIYGQAEPQRPVTPPIPFSTVPFQRDPGHVDRGALSDELRTKLGTPGARVALVGLGGVGKSQLAIEYAYTRRAETPELYVFWLHAGTAARIDQGVRNILDTLRIDRGKDPGKDDYQVLRTWLMCGRPWLVIIDNADEVAHILGPSTASIEDDSDVRFDHIPVCDHGSVLITTRNMDVAARLVRQDGIINVSTMSRDLASTLMRKKLRTQESEEEITQLAIALDCMPLAMAQAAAYISHRFPRCSVRGYLDRLEQSRQAKLNLLSTNMSDSQRDRKASNSIIQTWQISFEYIRRARPSAAQILGLMSFYDCQSIPDSLLTAEIEHALRPDPDQPRQSDDEPVALDIDQFTSAEAFQIGRDVIRGSQVYSEDTLEDDIQLLRDFSFISVITETKTFKMHAIVQLGTQEWLRKSGRYDTLMRLAIVHLHSVRPFLEGPSSGLDWAYSQRFQPLIPHVMVISQLEVVDRAMLWMQAILTSGCASYHGYNGQYETAEELLLRCLPTLQKLGGEEHAVTLGALNSLGIIYRHQGRIKESTETHSHVLDISRRTLGFIHPRTLAYMDNLAVVYHSQGRHDDAFDLHSRVLGISKWVYGDEHPFILKSMCNLATVWISKGHLSEAKTLLKAIDRQEQLHGGDPLCRILTVETLGEACAAASRFEEARDLRLQAWGLRGNLFGFDDSSASRALLELLIICLKSQPSSQAEEYISGVMRTRATIEGPEHLGILRDKHVLGKYYAFSKRYEAAIAHLEPTLESVRKILTEEGPNSLEVAADLAVVYYLNGYLDKAKSLGEEAFEIQLRVLGADHKATLSTMRNLSIVLFDLGYKKSVMDLMTRYFAECEKVPGLSFQDRVAKEFDELINERAKKESEHHDIDLNVP